jgi:predicted outer membrane protein
LREFSLHPGVKSHAETRRFPKALKQLAYPIIRLNYHEAFLMKTFISIIFTILCFTNLTSAQSNPKSSSRSAAQYDAASIDQNISDNRDVIYFSQVAIERGTIAETKDLARDMLADFTGLLYSMEQLATAGGGSSVSKGQSSGSLQEAKNLNAVLSGSRGFSFDTAWIGGVLRMHQLKMSELTEQKTNATNERLKVAVTESIPVLKRYITRLTSLQRQLIKRDQQEKREAARRAKQ